MSDDHEQRFIDLLESQHRFPDAYLFKAICRGGPDAVQRVFDEVCQRSGLVPAVSPPARRPSAHGKYTSVTLELVVHEARDVLRVYRILAQIDDVVSYF
jgi:putative lipoic acid-binding regulatory protein